MEWGNYQGTGRFLDIDDKNWKCGDCGNICPKTTDLGMNRHRCEKCGNKRGDTTRGWIEEKIVTKNDDTNIYILPRRGHITERENNE